MTAATARQIGAIHALSHRAGFDDDMRRDYLEREAGVRSTKALTMRQAVDVIDKLKGLVDGKTDGAVKGLDTPVAKKLRALWISGYDLGLVADRSDRAMLAFLERQTKVSHTRFLNQPGQASAAVEGIKEWLARDGGVEWPADRGDVVANKLAVMKAQWLKLVALGAVKPFIESDPLGSTFEAYCFRIAGHNGWCFFEPAHYTAAQNALGRKLRHELKKREARP
jgi:hypothetical protein